MSERHMAEVAEQRILVALMRNGASEEEALETLAAVKGGQFRPPAELQMQNAVVAALVNQGASSEQAALVLAQLCADQHRQMVRLFAMNAAPAVVRVDDAATCFVRSRDSEQT